MDDPTSLRPGTRCTARELVGSKSQAALYLRVADTLDRSAALAESHADRLRSNREEQLARRELQLAKRAREAAGRGRALASRLGGPDAAARPADCGATRQSDVQNKHQP